MFHALVQAAVKHIISNFTLRAKIVEPFRQPRAPIQNSPEADNTRIFRFGDRN